MTTPSSGAAAVPSEDERAEIEGIALDIAVAAADIVLTERPRDLGVDATKSTRTDIVTVMDLRSQDYIVDRIAAARPGDAVFGEERGGLAGGSGITWVVDPIDGTVNYLYGIPEYAVSIAAVTGDPRTPGAFAAFAGVVAAPATGEVFHARTGGGAWLRRSLAAGPEERLDVSPGPELAMALVATGFGYDPERRAWQADVLREVLPQVRDIRRIGCAALDLCHVATGRLDGFYETGLNPWDFAAAWVVAREAGVVVGGLAGPGTPATDLTWAAPPALAGPLSGVVIDATRRHRGA